jgi:hypothetical protein
MKYLKNLSNETLLFQSNTFSIPAGQQVPVYNPEILEWPEIKACLSGETPKLSLVNNEE